jgi:hypothetical protein
VCFFRVKVPSVELLQDGRESKENVFLSTLLLINKSAAERGISKFFVSEV